MGVWGGAVGLTVPSASAEMTLPSADSDLLMFLASSSTAPSAPVLLTCGAATQSPTRTSNTKTPDQKIPQKGPNAPERPKYPQKDPNVPNCP